MFLGFVVSSKGVQVDEEKMNSTSFQGLENQKTSEIFWYKEEEEFQRDSRLVKDCKKLMKLALGEREGEKTCQRKIEIQRDSRLVKDC